MSYVLRLAIILSLTAGAVSGALAQAIYKSVTPDGRIVYADHPPTDGQVLKTITPDSSPSTALPISAMEQLRRLRALRPAASTNTAGVVLYTASWCGYCAQAKSYLSAKGIAYKEIDIDTSEGLASFAQASSGKGVPLLLAGDQRIQGFSPAAYDQLFAKRR